MIKIRLGDGSEIIVSRDVANVLINSGLAQFVDEIAINPDETEKR